MKTNKTYKSEVNGMVNYLLSKGLDMNAFFNQAHFLKCDHCDVKDESVHVFDEQDSHLCSDCAKEEKEWRESDDYEPRDYDDWGS
jgi:hypothetical protein